MLQRIALSLGCAVILLSSTYVMAQEDNYVFREPVHMSTVESVDNNPGNGGDGGQDPSVVVTPPNNINFNDSGTTTTGNADADNIVYVYDENGNNIGNGFVDEEGNFSITLNPPVAGGDQLTYVAENGDGVKSEEVIVVVPDHINIDLTEPYNITFSEDGDIVSGEADPNVSIIIEDESGNIIGTGETDGNGNFSIPVNPSVTGGDDITLRSEDEYGNVSDDVLVTVPDGIGVQYDDCNIEGRRYAEEGDCVWFDREGEFLGLLIRKYSKPFNNTDIFYDYVQIDPSGPTDYNDAINGCSNNQLNEYDYRSISRSDALRIKRIKEEANLEKFSTSDGWTWINSGKVFNIRTGEEKDANRNERYDKYCILEHVRPNWF